MYINHPNMRGKTAGHKQVILVCTMHMFQKMEKGSREAI